MKKRHIKEGAYWMGAIDWDRRLFDSLIPLPDGTTYNAYLVRGREKTALMEKHGLDVIILTNPANMFYMIGDGRLCAYAMLTREGKVAVGKDEGFRKWFSWSNKEFANHKGLISRRLLRPLKGGNYTAIVEHESHETFTAMHNSPKHGEVGKRVAPLLDGHQTPQFYEVIVEQRSGSRGPGFDRSPECVI